jgi:hypothetical protein
LEHSSFVQHAHKPFVIDAWALAQQARVLCEGFCQIISARLFDSVLQHCSIAWSSQFYLDPSDALGAAGPSAEVSCLHC